MGCLFSCDDEDDEPMAETEVELSATRKGSQVRLEGGEVHGSGTVFADAAIHQDAAYWEVKVPGSWDRSAKHNPKLQP